MTADPVHLVIGWMPYEFTEVLSVWTTLPAAEAEVKRLAGLVTAHNAKKKTTAAEVMALVEQTAYCSDFDTKTIGVQG